MQNLFSQNKVKIEKFSIKKLELQRMVSSLLHKVGTLDVLRSFYASYCLVQVAVKKNSANFFYPATYHIVARS